MTTISWPKAFFVSLISLLIIVQSANQSLYSMFALLHGASTVTLGKQCVCCMRSNHNLYVYTFYFDLLLNFKFFILEFCYKQGWNLYVYFLMYVSSFLDYYVTCCYNLIFFGFSGRESRRAPVHRFPLRMNPGI